MSPYKEEMIKASELLPFEEAFENSDCYEEFVDYLQAKIGGCLTQPQEASASIAWEELIHNNK